MEDDFEKSIEECEDPECRKTIKAYFTRVSQIKEKIQAVEEEVENGEIVMTTLMVSLGHGTPLFKGFVLEESKSP